MKHLTFAFLLFFFFLPNATLAADAGWKIANFSSVVGIQTDGYVRIREIIHADFGPLERHGIFRDIPVGYRTSDGKDIALEARVNSVTDGTKPIPYASSNTNGYLRLKIGDPDILVTGAQAYVIDYTLRGVLREFENYDELYWNVTGNQWPVPILHAEATFALPTKDGIAEWSCYFGRTGSAEDCGGEKKSESVAYFEAPRPLGNGEGMTFTVGFAKGLVPIPPPLAEDRAEGDSKISLLALALSFFAALLTGIFFLASSRGFLWRRKWWRPGRVKKGKGIPQK